MQTAKTLRGWEKELLRAAAPDADTAFKVLRTQFGTLSDARDTAQQTASAALEAAFDFMEQAFAESQEMVVFVTELTLSPAAHAFIAENGCERYFQYNKRPPARPPQGGPESGAGSRNSVGTGCCKRYKRKRGAAQLCGLSFCMQKKRHLDKIKMLGGCGGRI